MREFLEQQRHDAFIGTIIIWIIFSVMVGVLIVAPSGVWTAIIGAVTTFFGLMSAYAMACRIQE